MPTKDLSEIKNKIISFLENNGPSLPSQIARHIQTDMIFASAFLSELYSEKKLNITNMKVGSSPIYYLKGQEDKLEKFASEYLKSKEKDAFEKLKQKRILKDKDQEPAIRIALREIKDFAFPERKDEEIYWRYFLQEKKILEKILEPEKEKPQESENKENKKEESRENKETLEQKNPLQKKTKKTKKKKPSSKGKSSSKKDEKFFNKVKEYLRSKEKEIEDIITFNKNELILKIKENEKESLVIAFNKKRITEEDITKVYKKIADQNLKYSLLSLGEPAKKTENLIEAIKKLNEIKKIE
jgi:hypothetical protein